VETATLLNGRLKLVEGLNLLAGVSPADCRSIIAPAREKRYVRKQTIFSDGEPIRHVMVLLSGCVKVIQIGLSGNEVILRLNGVGEIVGAFHWCAHCHHSSTVITVQPCVGLIWDAADFERLLGQFPTFRRNTVHALEQRLQEMEQRFREVSTERVQARLSSELLRLSNRMGRPSQGDFEIALSRAELAQLTGTTLFTVSRLLCQWQSLGIVKNHREGVLVRDFAALNQLSQSE
jgi:CRP-like cAMP-binding protein